MGSCCDSCIPFILNFLFLLSLPILIPFIWLPNVIYEFFSIYHPDCFRRQNNHENHKKKVERVQEQVKAWNKGGRKKKMCTARPNWKTLAMRNVNKSKFTQIKLDLEDIIEIDTVNMTIKLEPGIQMGTLTHKLIPLGLTIPVVPELDTLTVGGLINGAGIESSSHKYSIFGYMALEYEIVLADGSVVTCSEAQHSDLFYCTLMSYGTLGFMTSVTFPLIRAGKYVKLEYHPSTSISQTEALLKRTENEFIEGIAYGKHNAVVMLGNFADKAESGKVNHINLWYKPWFYHYVERFLDETKVKVEYIPTRDYYHRHTRGIFWIGGQTLPMTRTRLFMFLFGWIFPLNLQFMKGFVPKFDWFMDIVASKVVMQDFVVSISKLEASLSLSHNLTEVYPIWLCPSKFPIRPGLFVSSRGVEDYYIDIGIYGKPPKNKLQEMGDATVAVRILEEFCIEHNGFQAMYADSYLSREEFYAMFDPTLYNKLRTELNCLDAFPDIYDKVSLAAKRD